MLIALFSIFLSTHLALAAENYCPFTFKETISVDDELIETDSEYFYFDVEGYKKQSFSNLEDDKSGEFSIQGDFGSLIQIYNDGTRVKYSAESLSFHIPPEHIFDDEADLEVMVHHSASVGRGLVLSFLFSTSKGEETSSRQFFNDLTDATDGSSDIDPTDISGGYYHIKEFYYNSDTRESSTSNECNQNKWAVYSKIVKMSESHLKNINENLVEVNEEARETISVDYAQYVGSQDEYSSMLVLGIVYLIV